MSKDLQAWKPLKDCQRAFQKLELIEDANEWRIYWVACVSLLRSIGHVLNSVDVKISPDHTQVIKAHWETLHEDKQKHRIFWEFIQQERNNVLKNYKFGPEWFENAFVVQTVDGEQVVFDEDGQPFTQDMLMMDWDREDDGDCPFHSLDGRDLIDEALEWWVAQLHGIQKQLEVLA